MNTLDKSKAVVVAGGGGFIGGWLVAELLKNGFRRVRSVDIKPIAEWHQVFGKAENLALDLRDLENCRRALRGAAYVFNLAADMGGMGFIETHKADCMLSVLINTHLLLAAREFGIERYFFASSACVYAAEKQTEAAVRPLAEVDAYPAMPEDGYGWEKLFSERMCRHFREDYGIATRIARYHNVYGPCGTWTGGREKAPAAICRKVAEAVETGRPEIEIWGDGEQTRSFMYVTDCIKGTLMLMQSGVVEPINIGSAQLVTINQLADMVQDIAGVRLRRRYNLDAAKGVRGRNSDNGLIRKLFDWEPDTRLEDGLVHTYRWVRDQVRDQVRGANGGVAAGLG